MSIYRKADFQPNYTDYLDAAGRMIDQRYAKFAVTTLSDEEVSGLSLATMAMPENSIGYQAYITWVSGTDAYVHELLEWGYRLAKAVAYSKYKSKDGQRRRTLVEGFREDWGRAAVKDAYSMVMADQCPDSTIRAAEFHCFREKYQLIRDFVAASIASSIKQFKFALEWSWGYRDDNLFANKFKSLRLKQRENGVVNTMKCQWSNEKFFGTSIHDYLRGGRYVKPARTDDDEDRRDPPTLYRELSDVQDLAKESLSSDYFDGGPIMEFHGAEAEAYILANPSQPSSGATDR